MESDNYSNIISNLENSMDRKINRRKYNIFKILIPIIIISVIFYYYFRPIKGNYLITHEYKNSNAFINELYMSDEYFKKSLLNEEDYYIYQTIIEKNIEDETKIIIKCSDDCANKFSKALNAVYLDHPELLSFKGINSYQIHPGYISYNNHHYFSKIKSYFASKRIAREMENIRNKTKNMSEKEKIIFVYNYVGSHNYDRIFMYSSSNQSAYSFFSKGESVCVGFAKATQIIFQNIGIKSYPVLTTNHMFNYVEYNGKYYIFDATYAASFRDKTHENYYNGLGNSTTGVITGLYSEYYPDIETTKLKDIFGI